MRDRQALPFFVTVGAIALYSVMDGLMKGASLAVGAYSAMLWRSLVGAALVAPLWLWRGGRWPGASTMRLHLLRGAVSAGMAVTFFYGLTLLPMAEAIAISFIAPLIALYLAAATLGETIRRRAVAASLLGLAGVAVIALTRLSASHHGDGTGIGIASVLLSAVLYACNLVLQRRQSQVAQPLEIASFMNATVLLTLLPAAPWLAQMPDSGATSALILGAAALAVGAGMMLSWAYARAETQVLVPVEYTAFGWAALMGWLAFGERLTWSTLLGTGLVVAACWIAAPRKQPEPVAL